MQDLLFVGLIWAIGLVPAFFLIGLHRDNRYDKLMWVAWVVWPLSTAILLFLLGICLLVPKGRDMDSYNRRYLGK